MGSYDLQNSTMPEDWAVFLILNYEHILRKWTSAVNHNESKSEQKRFANYYTLFQPKLFPKRIKTLASDGDKTVLFDSLVPGKIIFSDSDTFEAVLPAKITLFFKEKKLVKGFPRALLSELGKVGKWVK